MTQSAELAVLLEALLKLNPPVLLRREDGPAIGMLVFKRGRTGGSKASLSPPILLGGYSGRDLGSISPSLTFSDEILLLFVLDEIDEADLSVPVVLCVSESVES